MHKGKKHHYKKRRSSKKQIIVEQVGCSNMMTGGGTGADHVIAVVGDMNNQHAQAGTNVIAQNAVGPEVLGSGAPVVIQNGGTLTALSPAPVQRGGKRRGKTMMAGLAVPTVLLYANKIMGRKSAKGRKSRGSRKTRKH